MTILYFLLLFIPFISTISIDIRYPQFFHQSLYDSSIEITEGKAVGSFIAFVNLINDANTIPSEWLINTTNTDFKIQSNGMSYSLITTQVLDRERVHFYNFSVDAQHLVPPFEKISKNIRIRILDINDCVPTFNQTIYRTVLIPKETTFTVQAYDCDELNTDNSQISYSLSNYQDLFRIDEKIGVIESIKDSYTYEHYEVIVAARDHGKPTLSSTTLVQIHVLSSKTEKIKTIPWLNIEQNSQNMILLSIISAAAFVFLCLLICVICCIKAKIKRGEQENLGAKKQYSSSSTINSLNDFQQAINYDAVNLFPNTYYLPVKEQTDFAENLNNSNNNETSIDNRQSLSTTSSPVSAAELVLKISSDDGCYCSSDMSSEQSNNILLLNPSSLTLVTNSKLLSKQVRFNEQNHHMDGVLKRFENLYGTRVDIDPCASYV